jgi:hypothetical protein
LKKMRMQSNRSVNTLQAELNAWFSTSDDSSGVPVALQKLTFIGLKKSKSLFGIA